jgi:hypothetical protein
MPGWECRGEVELEVRAVVKLTLYGDFNQPVVMAIGHIIAVE